MLRRKMRYAGVPDITDDQLVNCMPNMMYADLAARFHHRELAIRAIGGFRT